MRRFNPLEKIMLNKLKTSHFQKQLKHGKMANIRWIITTANKILEKRSIRDANHIDSRYNLHLTLKDLKSYTKRNRMKSLFILNTTRTSTVSKLMNHTKLMIAMTLMTVTLSIV